MRGKSTAWGSSSGLPAAGEEEGKNFRMSTKASNTQLVAANAKGGSLQKAGDGGQHPKLPLKTSRPGSATSQGGQNKLQSHHHKSAGRLTKAAGPNNNETHLRPPSRPGSGTTSRPASSSHHRPIASDDLLSAHSAAAKRAMRVASSISLASVSSKSSQRSRENSSSEDSIPNSGGGGLQRSLSASLNAALRSASSSSSSSGFQSTAAASARARQATSVNRLLHGQPTTLPGQAHRARTEKMATHTYEETNLNRPFVLKDFTLLRALTTDTTCTTYIAIRSTEPAPESDHIAPDTSNFSAWYAAATNVLPLPSTLKVIRKTQIVKRDLVPRIYRERSILNAIRSAPTPSPFIAAFHSTWQDRQYLYILAEWGSCTLRELISGWRKVDEDAARFWGGECILGLEWLHARGIVFGELQPECVLVTEEGHVKLWDFGRAVSLSTSGSSDGIHQNQSLSASSSSSIQQALEQDGPAPRWTPTPAYAAPEVLAHHQAIPTPASDWWSLGVLLHELLLGEVPFGRDPSPRHTLHMIETYGPQLLLSSLSVAPSDSSSSTGTTTQVTSIGITSSARDLLLRLLNSSAHDRLGSWHGSEDIKCHVWFRPIKQWRRLGPSTSTGGRSIPSIASSAAISPPLVPGPDRHVVSYVQTRASTAGGLSALTAQIMARGNQLNTKERSRRHRRRANTKRPHHASSPALGSRDPDFSSIDSLPGSDLDSDAEDDTTTTTTKKIPITGIIIPADEEDAAMADDVQHLFTGF